MALGDVVMLLKFSCDNFKSFRDGFNFDMLPNLRMNELRDSIISEKIGRKSIKVLPSSVIYGANAYGKTSVINAMSCFREIILRGNIQDDIDDKSIDHVSHMMNLIPFAFQDDKRPVKFDVTFTFSGKKYRYCLSFYLGAFLEKDVSRYIDMEQLYLNDIMIFERTRNAITQLLLKPLGEMLNKDVSVLDTEKIMKSMTVNLVEDALLLLTDFNSFCSKKIVAEIKEWFRDYFMVINSSDKIRFVPEMYNQDKNIIISKRINEIAEEAGIFGSSFAYVSDPDSRSVRLMSLFQDMDAQRYTQIESDDIESSGTLRLVSIMPAILIALQKGAVLVIDELDASLHPMIVINLISIFHNSEVNKNKAQIVFNTHNPVYINNRLFNNRLFRRDEIKFVERDRETKSSELYSLSDFKANGAASVRKTTDYMKNYFVSRYGGIENIDFTDIVKEVLNEGDFKNE